MHQTDNSSPNPSVPRLILVTPPVRVAQTAEAPPPARKPRSAPTLAEVELLAEPPAAASNGHRSVAPDISGLDRETLLAALREVFRGRARLELETDAVIRAASRTLGYGRAGARIQEKLKHALQLAVRRGILYNERGEYRLDRRTIEDYSQEECIEALLASMPRAWTERDEAIRGAARHLGFRRTGQAIQDAFKSAINGAIRRGRLEYDRHWIRKIS
jgi:hypothetical protein